MRIDVRVLLVEKRFLELFIDGRLVQKYVGVVDPPKLALEAVSGSNQEPR
jgi:hypothetical protein